MVAEPCVKMLTHAPWRTLLAHFYPFDVQNIFMYSATAVTGVGEYKKTLMGSGRITVFLTTAV